MYVDNASSNGKRPQGDVAHAVGELGKHFIGKWSGLGDYFKALDVAGPVIAKRLRPRPQLGASSPFLTLAQRVVGARVGTGGSPYVLPQAKTVLSPTAPRLPAVNIITATRQVLQSTPKPSILTPAINVVSQPASSSAPAPAPSVDPYYNAPLSQPASSGGNGGVPSPPVEIGTLDVSGDSSGNPLAGLSANSPLLLLIAAAAFYFLDGKPKKRRRR